MKTVRKMSTVIAMLLIAIMSCYVSAENPNVKNVTLGEVFTIDLPGNETTGYTWALAQMPPCVYLLNTEYNPIPPIKPGSPGIKTFTFKAMAASKGDKLVFKEMRPWMNGNINEQIWTVIVNAATRYQQYTDYFALSRSTVPEYLVLTNYDVFYKYFNPAAVMKRQQWIEKADFDKNLVVAKTFGVKQIYTELAVKSVTVEKNILVVDYTTKETAITWYAQCYLLLLVEKG